jgi:hypothetical protein
MQGTVAPQTHGAVLSNYRDFTEKLEHRKLRSRRALLSALCIHFLLWWIRHAERRDAVFFFGRSKTTLSDRIILKRTWLRPVALVTVQHSPVGWTATVRLSELTARSRAYIEMLTVAQPDTTFHRRFHSGRSLWRHEPLESNPPALLHASRCCPSIYA